MHVLRQFRFNDVISSATSSCDAPPDHPRREHLIQLSSAFFIFPFRPASLAPAAACRIVLELQLCRRLSASSRPYPFLSHVSEEWLPSRRECKSRPWILLLFDHANRLQTPHRIYAFMLKYRVFIFFFKCYISTAETRNSSVVVCLHNVLNWY